jgi:hypothetical protein
MYHIHTGWKRQGFKKRLEDNVSSPVDVLCRCIANQVQCLIYVRACRTRRIASRPVGVDSSGDVFDLPVCIFFIFTYQFFRGRRLLEYSSSLPQFPIYRIV